MKERPIITGGNEARRIRIDDAALVKLFHDGKTIAEIAAELGCSAHPVKKALKRIGLRRAAKRNEQRAAAQIPPETDCHWVASSPVLVVSVCVFEFEGARYLVSSKGGIVRVLR